MTPDIRKKRETALYEAALRLIAKGVNPAAMKVQQIADEAGIGKGTVYEYFASKDEILQGMALYCFDTEIDRIAVLMEPCTTLQELEDAVMAYLQDLSGNRMGTYQVIASSIGARENLRGMDECVQALRGVLHRTMAALRQNGEINPALPDDYCDLALLSAAAGGGWGCAVLAALGLLLPLVAGQAAGQAFYQIQLQGIKQGGNIASGHASGPGIRPEGASSSGSAASVMPCSSRMRRTSAAFQASSLLDPHSSSTWASTLITPAPAAAATVWTRLSKLGAPYSPKLQEAWYSPGSRLAWISWAFRAISARRGSAFSSASVMAPRV